MSLAAMFGLSPDTGPAGRVDEQGQGIWIKSSIPGAPDRFLEEPGALTDAERRAMQISARINKGNPRLN